MSLKAFSLQDVQLNAGELRERRDANRRYMMKLTNDNLLQNYTFEAGLWSVSTKLENIHWGWETPTSNIRGHFLGHWLSAAAKMYAATGDREMKAKLDTIIDGLACCQKENGGEWAGSFPEKYLDWIARGKKFASPHYIAHKTFMGLMDAYKFAHNQTALEIADNWANWFYRWTNKFTREELDNILDYETGGMLEIWADLLAITNKSKYRELLSRYYRSRLFDSLLEGKDVLTNMHVNTTIPEILGVARAWEVTGEPKWLDIVKAYWTMAVTERGQYCTGGQSSGEVWSPMGMLSARLSDKNQEHCIVYHMMRLAEFLFRQTGEAQYADYWEQNLYNGILAQGYWKGKLTHGFTANSPLTGLISYFLPLRAGSQKGWSSETEHFYCCHGTLVQANATHTEGIYYQSENGIVISQYIPSKLTCKIDGNQIVIDQNLDPLTKTNFNNQQAAAICQHIPDRVAIDISVTCAFPTQFKIGFRLPWWLKGKASVRVNGEEMDIASAPSSFIDIERVWENDRIRIELPKGLTTYPLPDNPEIVAFMDGPVVLAGLCDEERILYGDKEHPETVLIPDNEREWEYWLIGYRTYNQERGIRFIPLKDVGYEKYTVYFQIKKSRNA